MVNDRYGRRVITIPPGVREKENTLSRRDIAQAIGEPNLHQLTSLADAFDLVDQMPGRATAIVRLQLVGNSDAVLVLTKDSGGPVIEIRPSLARLTAIDREMDAARYSSVIREAWVALFDENGVLIPPPNPSPGPGVAPATGPSAPGQRRPGGGSPSPGPVVSFQDVDPFAPGRPARKRHRTLTGVIGPDGLEWGVVNYKNPVTGQLSGMDEPEEPTGDSRPDGDKTAAPNAVEQPESTPDTNGQPTADSRVPEFRRPSDEAVDLFHRILDAEQAGDPHAGDLRAEAQRLIPDDGERAYAERYVGNERRAAALAAELGMTPDQLRTQMTEELRRAFSGEIVIRVRAMTLLNVIDSRRFKTVFETAARSLIGRTQLERRAELERELFGYALDLAAESRPVYARVRTTRGSWEQEGDMADEYGGVDVVLKTNVASRTTASVGSPWGVRAIPSSVTDPRPESFAATPSQHGELAYFGLEGIDRDYAGERFLRNSYIEAQIHGGVTIADIDHVVFHREPPDERLQAALAEAGIPWSMASAYSGNSSAAESDTAISVTGVARDQRSDSPGATPWRQATASEPVQGSPRDEVEPEAGAFDKPRGEKQPGQPPTNGAPTPWSRKPPAPPSAQVDSPPSNRKTPWQRIESSETDAVGKPGIDTSERDTPAAGESSPVAARPTGLIGGVPDLVDPFDDRGAPWDRGGQAPRHKRIERLAEPHATGGGSARGGEQNDQGDLPEQVDETPHAGLSARQADMLDLIAEGRSSQEIAEALDIPQDRVGLFGRRLRTYLSYQRRVRDGLAAASAAPPAPAEVVGTERAPSTQTEGDQGTAPAVEGPQWASPTSTEEQRFVEWCRTRLADESGLPGQGLADYAEMHHLEATQVDRWLARAGLVESRLGDLPAGQFPHPGDSDTAAWLKEVRRYLAVPPERMDELLGAPSGTWHAGEQGRTELEISYLRSLLRRVPGARDTYYPVARLYPTLLTEIGTAAYPEGYREIADYMRFYREHLQLSRAKFADLVGMSYHAAKQWETGKAKPTSRTLSALSAGQPFPHGARHDELAENFPYLAREELIFPNPKVADSFGEYLRHFRRLNNLTISDATRIFGLSWPTIRNHENGSQSRDEIDMLKTHDRVLHRAGSWNDLGEAWGYGYRIDPDGEKTPDPLAYESVHEWFKAIRLHSRSTQESLGAAIGRSETWVGDVENAVIRPSVVRLRLLRDALDLPNETLVTVLRHFSTHSGDNAQDDDSELFWNLIATHPGSEEEKRIRNHIIDRYSWVARAVARRWSSSLPGEQLDELTQQAVLALMRTTTRFVPPGSFVRAAWSSAHHAMRRTYHERLYPNVDPGTRNLLIRVDGYIRTRYRETAMEPSNTEIARALDLNPQEVSQARSLLGHRAISLDHPDAPANATLHRDAALQPESRFADMGFLTTVREALSDMPDPELAERLVLLHFTEEVPLDELSTQLRITPHVVQGIIEQATERLREAFSSGQSGVGSTDRSSTPGGGHRADGSAPGPEVNFHDIIDERAALDLPPARQHRRPFGHMRGLPGLDPALAFHHNPDNGREWDAPENGAEVPPEPEISSSPEEQRFLEWYRNRPADGPGPRQGLAEYVVMHHLEMGQVQRWLARAGLDADGREPETIGQFPQPQEGDTSAWLSAARQYLGVTPRRMDELVDAPRGTWEGAERGERALDVVHVRALLRRIPGARQIYRDIARDYPELLTKQGRAAYPEGYSGIGEYIRVRREHKEWTRPQLADLISRPVGTVRNWEDGKALPPKEVVDVLGNDAQLFDDVTYDELAESFSHLPRESLIFPSPRVGESFGDYLRHFRRVNNLQRTDAARIFDISRQTIGSHEEGITETITEVAMVAIYRRVLHRAGTWQEMADAWGFSSQMDPAGGMIPAPTDYASVQAWLKELRLYHGMTQTEFASHFGKEKEFISAFERGKNRPGVVFLRELRDAFDLPNETLVTVLRRFYSHPGVEAQDTAVERLFWKMIATRPGSPEEQEVRNRIFEQHAWIANAAATPWAVSAQHRRELVQRGYEAILVATRNFVPPGEFVPAAWASARYAMLRAHFEHRYPDVDGTTRKLLITVGSYINRRFGDTGAWPDNAEIGQALGLKPSEVTEARVLLAQQTTSLSAPLTAAPDAGKRDVATPPATASMEAELPEAMRTTIRAALSDLREPELAEDVVLHHFIEGVPLEDVSILLSITQEKAVRLAEESKERLRAVFTEPQDADRLAGPSGDVAANPGPAAARPTTLMGGVPDLANPFDDRGKPWDRGGPLPGNRPFAEPHADGGGFARGTRKDGTADVVTAPAGQALLRQVLPADVHSSEILDSERSPALTVRLAAERMLRDLELHSEPIPLAPNGEPRWPAGMVGGTAGTGRYAAAAAAPGQTYRAIGLDAKDHEPVSRFASLRIAGHRERSHLRNLASAHRGIHWTQVLASAKDNAIDVQFGLTEAELGYQEIEVVLSPDPAHPESGSFEVLPAIAEPNASTSPLFSGRFRVSGGTVLTAITVPRASETPELSRDPDFGIPQRDLDATLAAPQPVADPGGSTEEPVYTDVATEPISPRQTAVAPPRASDPVLEREQADEVEPATEPTTAVEDDPPGQAVSAATPSESTKASVQPGESLPALSSGTATDAVTETPTTATTRDEPAPRPVALSEVETEILRRLVSGSYISEIAAELSISAATVSTHAQHIHRKLRAGNPAQLVEAARAAGVGLSAPAEQPEAGAAGVRGPAAARSTGLIGGVPDLVNPFDDRGAPWDRGGPVPRHERIERLAQAHADGGGFARGKQPTPPVDDSRQGDQPPQESSGRDDDAIDQHLWLEEAHGERQLAWARERTQRTVDEFASAEEFDDLREQILRVLNNPDRVLEVRNNTWNMDRIVNPARFGDWLFDFRRDADHPKGYLRRIRFADYRNGDQQNWETLLDFGALAEATDQAWSGGNWVFGQVKVLQDGQHRALIAMSEGGGDFTVVREFDLDAKRFIDPAEGGFELPPANNRFEWVDIDTLHVGTDFGPGSFTEGNYPRIVKRWRRGTSLDEAEILVEAEVNDVITRVGDDIPPGTEPRQVRRYTEFYDHETYVVNRDGTKTLLDVPASAKVTWSENRMLVQLADSWTVGEREYPGGSLLVTAMDRFLAGDRDFDVLFTPDAHNVLYDHAWTKNHVIVTRLSDVRTKIEIFTPTADGWIRRPLEGLPEDSTARFMGSDPTADHDDFLVATSGYTTPASVHAGSVDGELRIVESEPEFFDATDIVTEQFFATSADGTLIPYDFTYRRGATGPRAIIATGYGGFGRTRLPAYDGVLGSSWLEDGGGFVEGHIRGGGAYPGWQAAARGILRHKGHEDMAAIAMDLIARGFTTPEMLGAIGDSNGGLLMGAIYAKYPHLFGGGIVADIPLLDMRRFHLLGQGAIWKGEYGDPENPEEAPHIFSPYHEVRPGQRRPPILLRTSAHDDRVHPGHARKMAALLESLGYEVWYYESTEGGHGNIGDNRQAAFEQALIYAFFRQKLMHGRPAEPPTTDPAPTAVRNKPPESATHGSPHTPGRKEATTPHEDARQRHPRTRVAETSPTGAREPHDTEEHASAGQAFAVVENAAYVARQAAAQGDERQLKRLRRTIRQLGNPDYEHYLEHRFLLGRPVADATAAISGDRTADAVKSLRHRAVVALAKILPVTASEFVEEIEAADPRTTFAEHGRRVGWQTMWTLRLRAAIRSGRLAEGRSLPTALSVAEQVGLLSEISVGTAYRQLAREGYLVIEAGGVGTKVASRDRWPSTPPSDAGWLIPVEDLQEILAAEKSLNKTAGSVARMVSTALRGAILSGRLQPGIVLPTTSELGSSLPASNTPVKEAYRQLRAEGYLVSAHKEATMVADRDRWPTTKAETRSAPETNDPTPPVPPPRGHGLSELEVEVLELTAKGLSARDIAAAAHITRFKVHYSFERIRLKLGIHGDHAALVTAAQRRGIIGTTGDPGTREVPGDGGESRADTPSTPQQVTGRGPAPTEDAPRPAVARPTALSGVVPDLVNPLDDRGAPWDRGGQVPRHQRTNRLAETNIDGGGFGRGNQSDPDNAPRHGAGPNQVRYSDLLFNPTPEEAAAAAVRDLPTNTGPLGPELNLDFLPFFASDGLKTEEDVETVATAVGEMLREHNWRDTAQLEAAAELVRAAGLNAVTYMTSYTRALQRAGVSQWDEERALHGIQAKLMLRLSTQAGSRSLYMALEIDQYRPERSPDDEIFTWPAPLFSDTQVEAGVRTLLGSATVSDVEQWGEIWARFDEPRSDGDDALDEPPPRGDLEAKARIARRLYDDHHIRILGWEESIVPLQAVESVDRALRDRIAEYGSRFALRDVTFDDIEEFGLTRSFGTTTPDAKDHYTSITINRRIFTDPEVRREWAEQVRNHRYAESAEDMIYQLTHHEFIHVVVDDGNWMLHAPAMALLRSAYALYRDSELIPADLEFTEWLALLPHYALLSYIHPETETFYPVEGVAEGARAGAVESSLALTDPARILHWLTVTRDGSSPAPTLAQWAKRQAAVVGEGRDVLLLLHDFRDVTGRDDIEVPAELRPQDTTADVLEAATGGGLRHFTDVGEVIARLRAGGQSPDSPDDAVSALVVEDGRPYLLVRRATGSGTGRVEVRNPGEGVLRANHFLPVGSSDLPSVRAMFFDENGRPVSNDGTRPDTPAPAPAPSGQPTTPNPERGTASGPDPSPSGSSPDAPPALDLVSVTIPQLIEMLDSGQITSVQLTQVCLERIESLSALHAVIGLNPRALEEARRADELRRTGAGHSPLLGVPVLIKGSIDIEGMPTTAGSVALAQSYPAADATLVQQLRAAGAVILGHTNLTEFAFYLGSEVPRGYSSYGGQTLNPYDVSLLPGGSSSGSAVAVAAGLVPLAIGTQTIGSILEPCNYNSVVGFKPTVGAVSRTGVLPIATSRDSPGVISPDVTGAAVSLTAIVGVDPEDPATARNPLAGHDFTADLDPNALRGARIGILAAGIPAEDAPQRPLWDAVLDTLAAQGATLVPIDLDLNDSFRDNDPPWSSVFSYEFKRDLNAYLSRLPSDAPMKSLADIIAYNNAHAETALKYGQDRALSAEAMDLAPDSADTAKYRADLQLDLAESKDRIDAVMAEHNLTALASIYNFGTVIGDKPGYPCVIVPAGRTPADDEHPAGEHVNVTFRAGAWSEPTLIGYAYAFEQAHAVSRPRPLYADQLSRAAASKSAVAPQPDKTRGGSLRPADSSSTARQVTARGPAEDAAPQPGPAVARPTTLAGGAPVLENPFDDRGAPWDRGGRMPRHQRTNRLAELNVDGGGFSRARKGGDDPDSNPADEHTAPGPARDSAPAGNETHARPQPAVQRQPTDPAADEQVSIRQLLVVNKPFAKLLLGERIVWPPGEVANKFGTVIATSALPYVVLNETESAMAAGMAGAALWIPGLFELPAGYAADFVNRRKLMIAAQLLGAAAAATAAGLVFFEAPDLGPALTAATLAEATAAIFYLRAFDAAARDFLIKAHRDAGARLRTLTGQAADILGPALGPALANGVATWAPFGFNTLSYLGNLLNMRGVAFPPQTRRVPRNLLRELGEGAQTLWQEKFLRDVTAISAINNAAWAMLGLRTATVLHDADLAGWATGAVVAAPAVGGLMSDFVVRAFDKMDLSTLYQVALANMAVFSVLQASTAEPAVIAVASAVDAMMMWASNTRMAVYQQQAIPEQLQGRAGSVKGLFLRTGPAAGLLAAGALTASHGGDAAATVGAGITVATAAGYAALTLLRRGRGAARDAPAADPEVIANCAIHLARVFRALALTHDGSPEPDDTDPRWDSRKNWRLVEAALGAQLRPAAYDGDPRFSAVAETVRTKRDGIDLAVVVVDDGENAHPYTFVNVEGEVLVFDTLVDNTDSDLPRVRSYDGDENGEHKWEPKYHKVVQVFDAYYTSNAGTPSPVRKPVPRYRHIRHPHKIQGPPAYPPPQTGSGSPTDRTGDSRTDGERPARQTLSSPSATNSSATHASRTVGNAGRPDGRGFISGGIRTSPAGLIVPADPTAGLIVPAAYVIPADPSLEELMERLRPWKEIFHYFWEFPLPREGELSGREWIESAERKAWMRRRALRRTPLYAGVDAAVRLTLGAERLLGAPNATPGPATIEQRRVIPGRGPIDAGKNRTMRYDTQLREASPANADERTPFGRFWAAVSGDELPQTKLIRQGKMAYNGGRLLRAEGHNLMVAGRYAEGYELLVSGRDPVLTPEEYALWLMFDHDALWTLHFPGCRQLEPQSPEFLLTRYLTIAIFDKIASKPLEAQYLDDVVRPYLRRQGVAAGRVLLHELAHYLPESCRTTTERLGTWALRGLGRRVGAEVREHLDNCAACRNTAALLPAAQSNSGERKLLVPPGPAGDGSTNHPSAPVRTTHATGAHAPAPSAAVPPDRTPATPTQQDPDGHADIARVDPGATPHAANRPAPPAEPQDSGHGQRVAQRPGRIRPGVSYPQLVFDPTVALDLPPRRASGLDGLGFDPPPVVAEPFGDLPHGVVAHAANPADPNGGAFGGGRSRASRIARAALSTFRVEATLDDLQNWAARLSDDDLHHLLIGFTHTVAELIAAIHRGESPGVTDHLTNPARLLVAIVVEGTRRFGDGVPPSVPATYREFFATESWLRANRWTLVDLHSAMIAVLDVAYAVTRTSTVHHGAVSATHHTVPAHLGRIARRIEEAGRHSTWLEENSFPPDAALQAEHVRHAESFLGDEVRGRTMAQMVLDWSYVMNTLLQLRSGEAFSPGYEELFETLPIHVRAVGRARTGSDELFATTLANALPALLDAAFYLLPTSNFALGLKYLRQVDQLLAEAITRFADRSSAVHALQEAVDDIHKLYEDIVVADSARLPEQRMSQIHAALSDYFGDRSEFASTTGSFWWGLRALWGLGHQSPRIHYAREEYRLDAVLPWDWHTTDDERAFVETALDVLRKTHGPGADMGSLLHQGDSPDLVESVFDSVGKNMRWWYKIEKFASGYEPIGMLLSGATDYSVPEMHLAVLRQYPHIIGAAAGIDYRVRDLANRLSLARDLESLSIPPERRRELSVLREQLAEVQHQAFQLTIHDVGVPPVLLVSYDPVARGGTGRAVVSIGEADSASFMAFNITGADTPVTDLAQWSVGACQLYKEARQHGPADARLAIMLTVGKVDAPSRTAGPDATPMDNVVEARDFAGKLAARELVTYDATRELALDGSEERWSRMVRRSTAIGHGEGIGVLRSAADTLRLDRAVDQIVLVPDSAGDQLPTATQLNIGAEDVYTLNPHRDRNGDPKTIGLIVVGHGDEIESAPDASGLSTAPLIDTPTTVREVSQLLSAHEYRPLEGRRGITMTHDEGLTVYRAAQPLLRDALKGTYNTTVVLEELGLVVRIGQPGTDSYDPRFGPEHSTLLVISQYVRHAPQLLKVLTGRMPDGRVIDESAPVLIERLARGNNLAETFRRADRRTIQAHQGLILRTFANIHEQLRAMPDNHPLLHRLTPPGVAKDDTGGWYLNHIDWYTENFYRRHYERFGDLFDEFGLLRGDPFAPLIDEARSMRESRHHILHADPNAGNFLISNQLRVTLLDWELAVTGPSAYDWARLGHLIPGIEVPRELGGPDMVKFARVEKFKRVMNDTVKLAPLAVAGQLTPELIEFIETEFSEAVIQVRQLSGHTNLLPPRAELEILRSWRP
ncbi:MFS transporter [Nocardia beijingensis]